MIACGGGTKNPVFLREHADVTGCRIVLPREPEAVLLGSAMLGAVAAGDAASLPAAMAAMSGLGRVLRPQGGEVSGITRANIASFIACTKTSSATATCSHPGEPVAIEDIAERRAVYSTPWSHFLRRGDSTKSTPAMPTATQAICWNTPA